MKRIGTFIASGLWIIALTFVSPVGLFTILGPLVIINLNSDKIQNSLCNPLHNHDKFEELKQMVCGKDLEKWTEAYNEFNMQYTIILVAFIITAYEIISGIIFIFNQYARQNRLDQLYSDNLLRLFGAASIFFLAWAIPTIFFGGLASPENIELIKLNSVIMQDSWMHQKFNIIIPPNKFLIPRAVISLYNGMFAYLILKRLRSSLST